MRYANRLKRYCNQTATLERAGEPDKFGKPVYAAPKEIKVRKQAGRKLVRDAEGNTVISNTTVFCIDEIKAQDKIDGLEVISAGDWIEFDGTVCGWEAYL